jgi:ATP-dependent protease ClpP protease subunit
MNDDYEWKPNKRGHWCGTDDSDLAINRRKTAKSTTDTTDSSATPTSTTSVTSPKKGDMGASDDEKCVTSKDNHIFFYASVTKKSVYALNNEIMTMNRSFEEFERTHPMIRGIKPRPIILHINSYGGSVFAAFAAIDFIQQSKIPIYTVVEGATASAGTLMSVVGKKRFIRPTGSMLIHQLSTWFGGKMNEIEDEYKNLEQMMNTIRDIYVKHTKMTETQLKEFLAHDVWWMSAKCIELGLVDGVWNGTTAEEV